MNLFLGQYEHKLDGKGRVFIPRRILEGVGDPAERDRFILTLGLDPCLYLFTRPGFLTHLERLAQAAFDDPALRRAIRGMGSRSVELTLDAQGRILIPEELRNLRQLSAEVVVVGAYDHVEFWDKKYWDEVESDAAESTYLEQATELFRKRPAPTQGVEP